MSGEDWIRSAMSDESLVAEMLLRLHHAVPQPKKSDASPLKLKWSVRQRRSKATSSLRNKGDQTRGSPTTPLSWSGGATSVSGGGGATTVEGLEESSEAVNPSEIFRSKICQTSSTITTTIPFKRSRKKKTLAELKQDEIMLLKERKGLENELASMRELVEQQRSRNKTLKNMKSESQTALSCKPSGHDSSFLLPDLNLPLDNNSSPEVLC